MNKILLCTAAMALAIFSTVGAAQAHLVIENFKGRASYNEFLNLMVPHGCGPKATTQIRMKIPASVPLFAPESKDGWETELVMRTLDEPIRRPNGQVISEVYDEVIWRGELPANQLGVFKFLARMPSSVGSVVPFRTIQTCGDEEVRWVDVVDAGEPGWKMWVAPEPAPYVEVIEAPGPQLGATMPQLQAERQKMGASGGRE